MPEPWPEPTTGAEAWAQWWDAHPGDVAGANAAEEAFNAKALSGGGTATPAAGGADVFGLGAGLGKLGQSLVSQASAPAEDSFDMVDLVALSAGLNPEATAVFTQVARDAMEADTNGTGPPVTYNYLMSLAGDLGKKFGSTGAGGTSATSAYNAQRQFWQDQIDAGLATVEQAENAFTRWVNEEGVKLGWEQEAGQRAGDVNAILEKRARETMPEETVSGLNAMISKVSGNLGLPAVQLPAQPASAYPNPWDAYKEAKLGTLTPSPAPAVPFFQVPPPPTPGAAGVVGAGAPTGAGGGEEEQQGLPAGITSILEQLWGRTQGLVPR